MTAYEIIAKLEKKYATPSWAFFTEVKSAVGGGSRRADGIAVAMWRSLGLEIHGFEVKCSRSDWLKELKNGGKSDEIFQYCDRWWVVAAETSIVKDGELPPVWGLQIPVGRGIKIAIKAPKLKPVPLTTWFVAEILRRHFNSMKRPEQLDAEFQRGFEAGKEQATAYDLQCEIAKGKKLADRVAEFERASGVNIDSWQGPQDIGDAVKVIMEHGQKHLDANLRYARNEVAGILKALDEAITKIEARRISPRGWWKIQHDSLLRYLKRFSGKAEPENTANSARFSRIAHRF